MRTYTITRVSGTPDWSAIPTLPVDQHQWLPQTDIRMEAQLCYDPAGIHVHLRAWEQNIRAAHTEPLASVCEDSCMEFFFRPVAQELRYFNIEMNPLGNSYIGFGLERATRLRLTLKKEDQLLQKTANRLSDGWELYYTIPLALLRVIYPDYELKSGLVIPANCYKCGDLTVQPHYISWNPIQTETPNFHRPEDFGTMILE